MTHPGSGVDLGSVAQQYAHDVGLIGSGGQVQRCFTAHRGRVDAGAMLDEVQQYVHVPHERRHVQRRQTRLQQIALHYIIIHLYFTIEW